MTSNNYELKKNYEFEKEISNSMQEEIEAINNSLEFIIENSIDEISIKRNFRDESSTQEKLPPFFYDCGFENGTIKKPKQNQQIGYASGVGFIGESNNIMWEEWVIKNTNTENDMEVTITITPFLVKYYINENLSGYHQSEELKIFTDEIYNNWSERFVQIFIEKKKSKVPKCIYKTYKSLGIDRQAKIKTVLDD